MGADQLHRVLGTPELARLVDRLVARLESGKPLTGSLTLQGALPTEREAVTRLVGRRPSSGNSVSVDLDRLNTIVQDAALAPDLAQAVQSLRGPCIDRRAAHRIREDRWSTIWGSAHSRVAGQPPLAAWLDVLRREGILRRLVCSDPELGERLLHQTLNVLAQLPAHTVLLPEFAARTCGDSHALDVGQRLSALVLRALAMERGQPVPQEPADRRALWEHFGVICDELSAPALVLNLLGDPNTRLGKVSALHAADGEPYRVSTRQLVREGKTLGMHQGPVAVYVCENISVLAAAASRFGPRCPPMICIEGQPRTAACLLVDQLRSNGARLLYHGDFDWAGLSIANLMRARYAVEIWCMGTNDYLAAASSGTALSGAPVDASWDCGLREAMQREARAVHEEVVLNHLLADLSTVA